MPSPQCYEPDGDEPDGEGDLCWLVEVDYDKSGYAVCTYWCPVEDIRRVKMEPDGECAPWADEDDLY